MNLLYGQLEPLDILAIAPHPDDAEIGCGGTLLKAAQTNKRTGILELTRGEMGTLGTPEIRDAEALEAMVMAMEELQLKKVFDLARRLKPNLTLEDMRNPHDFPELEDPDWHYEDGVLTGIQSVVSAVRAYRRDHEPSESVQAAHS